MKALAAILVATITAAALPVQGAHGDDNHGHFVTLAFSAATGDTFPFSEPEFSVGCGVTVVNGTTAAGVLDQAVSDGCISSWGFRQFSFGRFVTEVNSTHGCNTYVEPLAPHGLSWVGTLTAWSWWEFRVNGESALVGIDDYVVRPNVTSSIGFLYHVELSWLGPAPGEPTGLLPGAVPCVFQ